MAPTGGGVGDNLRAGSSPEIAVSQPHVETPRLSPLDDKIQRYASKILNALSLPVSLTRFRASNILLGAPFHLARKVFSLYFKTEIKRFSEELDRCGDKLRPAITLGSLSKKQEDEIDAILSEVLKLRDFSAELRKKYYMIFNVVESFKDGVLIDKAAALKELDKEGFPRIKNKEELDLTDPGMDKGAEPFLSPPPPDHLEF